MIKSLSHFIIKSFIGIYWYLLGYWFINNFILTDFRIFTCLKCTCLRFFLSGKKASSRLFA